MALELMATAPFGCPQLSNDDHMPDGNFEILSTPMDPIKVAEERPDRYVKWEYEYITKALKYPFNRCQQQLIQDKEQKPVLTVDRIVVRDIKGIHYVFYFDISIQINKDRELYEKAYEDMKAGKGIDPILKLDFLHAERVKESGKRVLRFRPYKPGDV